MRMICGVQNTYAVRARKRRKPPVSEHSKLAKAVAQDILVTTYLEFGHLARAVADRIEFYQLGPYGPWDAEQAAAGLRLMAACLEERAMEEEHADT